MIVKWIGPLPAGGGMDYNHGWIRRFARRVVKRASDFHALVKKVNFFRFHITPLMVILNRLDIPGSKAFRLSLSCIIKGLAQLWGNQTRLAVPQARAVKLHEAKPEYRGDIFP